MKLLNMLVSLGLVLLLAACGNTSNRTEIEGWGDITNPNEENERLQPTGAPEDHMALPKPLELISNQLLVIRNQLYMYDASLDRMETVLQGGNIGLALSSPLNNYFAVISGQPGKVIIFDRQMKVDKEWDVQSLDDQAIAGVGDLKWLNDETLLVGLDYNANARAYYALELNREPSATKRMVAKASQGTVAALDVKGERLIYQYPNERYFSDTEAPALYVEDQMIFQGNGPDSHIGKLSVDLPKRQVMFPVSEEGRTMLIMGQYDAASNKLAQVERFELELAENEHLLDYALHPSWTEGFVLTQLEGERKLYKWTADGQPALAYLMILPESVPAAGMTYTSDQKLQWAGQGKVYVYKEGENEGGSRLEERLKAVREYLLEQARRHMDETVPEEHVAWIESWGEALVPGESGEFVE